MKRTALTAACCMALTGAMCAGAIELPPFFSDNMVFQRDKPLVIWGTAGPGVSLAVTLANTTAAGVADADGHWQVNLAPMPAGGPYELTCRAGDDHRHITGVYLGDVWVFSGQSNMQVSFDYFLKLPALDAIYRTQFQNTLRDCPGDTQIRTYLVATQDRNGQTVRNPAENRWFSADPNAVQHANPVAYYFAQDVARKTGVMTAAVRLAWGGQYIERFYRGADIFEYMVKPWGRFPVKGVVWYQGENNLYKDGDRLGYALKLQLLIRDYRRLWNDPALPFFIVQLPPARYSAQPFNDTSSLPVFLEAQRQALAIPFTAMANTSDLGMANGLHQPQKYELARRLAHLAFARVYGFADAVPAGPQYRSHTREGRKIRVVFETFGSTLTTRDGEPPKCFELLAADGQAGFVPAQAVIDGSSVLVWADDVTTPVDVRFAFREEDLMDSNLTNAAGIPAATFWAGATGQLHPDL